MMINYYNEVSYQQEAKKIDEETTIAPIQVKSESSGRCPKAKDMRKGREG